MLPDPSIYNQFCLHQRRTGKDADAMIPQDVNDWHVRPRLPDDLLLTPQFALTRSPLINLVRFPT